MVRAAKRRHGAAYCRERWPRLDYAAVCLVKRRRLAMEPASVRTSQEPQR